MAHHKYSPSRLQRVHDCPGSVRMESMATPEPKSADASEGTMLHEAVAKLLYALKTQNIVEEDPYEYALKNLDAEQRQSVESCIDFLKTLEVSCDVYIEKNVKIHNRFDTGLLTEGTADAVLVNSKDKTAHLIDWKFGRTPVEEAANNYQLAAYALGVFQEFNVESVTAHIYQPRAYLHTEYTFTKPENILTNLEKIIGNAESPDVMLRAGESQCKYCSAKSICPAFSARFAALTVEEKRDLTNPAVLLDYWNRAQVVERFMKELKEAVIDYCKEHGNLGEWYIQERAGRREVQNSVELCTRLNRYISAAEWRSCNTVNLGKLTDLLVEKLRMFAATEGQKLTIKAAKEKVESLIGDLITRGEPSSVLARKADK